MPPAKRQVAAISHTANITKKRESEESRKRGKNQERKTSDIQAKVKENEIRKNGSLSDPSTRRTVDLYPHTLLLLLLLALTLHPSPFALHLSTYLPTPNSPPPHLQYFSLPCASAPSVAYHLRAMKGSPWLLCPRPQHRPMHTLKRNKGRGGRGGEKTESGLATNRGGHVQPIVWPRRGYRPNTHRFSSSRPRPKSMDGGVLGKL